ncbi:MAG: amidohydrolase [Planctomycetia bacterium]|nr:amidohydrolase [Planctomycetia bacterium]
MTIDAHQHFWRYSPAEYPWIGPGMDRLAKDYLPADLETVARPVGVGGSVAVQARQSLAETRWLLDLAAADPFVLGVVGWVDLRSATVADELAAFVPDEKFVGVRHVVQDEPDPRFLLGEAFVRGVRTLHRFGLTYDLLLFPPQLPAASELVGLLPEQPFVLDHLAKPRIESGEIVAWRRDIEVLAGHENVCCKLSGMVTEAAWRRWKPADFTPYLDAALTAFGPERLMFGSDWPVCLVSGDYADVVGIVTDFIATLSAAEQDEIRHRTARRFYHLP